MPRIFFNPQSGSRSPTSSQEEEVRRLLPGCEITELTPDVDLKALARSAPPDLAFVAAGGDGTVNAVANAVCGTGRSIGVLPLGTLNHFASDLKIPLDLAGAAAVVAAAKTRRVDAAEVNGRIFINNSSLGAYPAMVMDRERMQKSGRSKNLALLAASFRAFVRFRNLQVELDVHGERRICTTPFLFAGNNEYCLDHSRPGASLGQREHLDQGMLALYLAPGATRLGVLRMAFAALLGRLKETQEHQEFLASEFRVRVHGRRRLRVSADGEVIRMPGPLHYKSLPGALLVIVPDATASSSV